MGRNGEKRNISFPHTGNGSRDSGKFLIILQVFEYMHI
jgi:hypothetical protein